MRALSQKLHTAPLLSPRYAHRWVDPIGMAPRVQNVLVFGPASEGRRAARIRAFPCPKTHKREEIVQHCVSPTYGASVAGAH